MKMLFLLIASLQFSVAHASSAAFFQACAESNGKIINNGSGQIDFSGETSKKVDVCYLDSSTTRLYSSTLGGKSLYNQNLFLPATVINKFVAACGDDLRMTTLNSNASLNAKCGGAGMSVDINLVVKVAFTCPR